MEKRVGTITLLLVAMLILATFGLAVPTINVNVQEIGSGNAPVCSPSRYGGFYYQVQDNTVTGVVAVFSSQLENATIYAVIHTNNGQTSYGQTSVSSLPPNTPVTIPLNQPVSFNRISGAKLVVADGHLGSYNGSIAVFSQKLGSGTWDGVSYANPINITYSGTEPLQNWPVRVVLTGNDLYVEWNTLRNSPESIRFVDSNGNLLYYWIEILDPDNQFAVIWVNLPLIPPGGTKIWMVYGTGDYSSYNDGHRVFPFFDDFETWSGWTQYRNGVLYQVNDNFEYGGSHAAEKTGNNDPNGAYKNLGTVFSRNNQYGGLILEYWDKRVRDDGGNLDRVGLIDDNGNGYGAVLNAINDQIRIDVRNNYRGQTHSNRVLNLNLNTWYLVQLEILSDGSITMRVYDGNYNLLDSTSYTDSRYSDFTRVYIFGGQTYHIDALRLRYYIQNPPEAYVDEWYRYVELSPLCNLANP